MVLVAWQRPQREGTTQDSVPGQSNTAAPEADTTVSTKLAGLVARAREETRLTNVVQYVDEELLRLAFRSLRKQAAAGVDGQTYEDDAANLDQNLKGLYARLKSGRYQALVMRRVYIPKANGKVRPLGITTIEDRVVQKAVAWVLGAVFEQDFVDCSQGFGPNRSPHTALHRLRQGMLRHWTRYVVEVDLVNYFGSVNWTWPRTFVRHRVNDGGLATFGTYEDAERFRREMDERLAAFGLHGAPAQTALLNFDASLLQGAGRPTKKPATFTFLGFIHFHARTRKGTVHVGRTPSVKARERFVAKIAKGRAHASV